jgi:hypothetical protein
MPDYMLLIPRLGWQKSTTKAGMPFRISHIHTHARNIVAIQGVANAVAAMLAVWAANLTEIGTAGATAGM